MTDKTNYVQCRLEPDYSICWFDNDELLTLKMEFGEYIERIDVDECTVDLTPEAAEKMGQALLDWARSKT